MTTSSHQSSPGDNARGMLRRAIAADDHRSSAPHEHALTVLAALVLALRALRTPQRSHAVVEGIAAGALFLRAASGRDGLRRWCGAEGARPVAPVPSAAHAAPASPGTSGIPGSGATA